MPPIKTFRIFFKSNENYLRFLFLFFVFFISGQALHYLFFPLTDPLQFNFLNAEVGSKIINLIHPPENAITQGNLIRSGNFVVAVGWGCEATDGMITLGAGILALQISFLQRITGLFFGAFTIYTANLMRIVLLFFMLKYKPHLFEIFHVYIGQIFLILIAICFFIFWAKTCHATIYQPTAEKQA